MVRDVHKPSGSSGRSRHDWRSRLLVVLAALLLCAAFTPVAPDGSSALRAAVQTSGVATHLHVNGEAVAALPVELAHPLNSSKPTPLAVVVVLALMAALFRRSLRPVTLPTEGTQASAALPLRRAPPRIAFFR